MGENRQQWDGIKWRQNLNKEFFMSLQTTLLPSLLITLKCLWWITKLNCEEIPAIPSKKPVVVNVLNKIQEMNEMN